MQQKTVGVVPSEGGDWRLSFRAVRVHYSHLSGGKTELGGCPICEEGLGGALARIAAEGKPAEAAEMDPGNGADEGGDPAPSPDGWADSG